MPELAPVHPNEFKALVPGPTTKLRDKINNAFVKLPVLLYKVMRWFFTSTGAATPEGKRWVCEGCANHSGTDETTTTTTA